MDTVELQVQKPGRFGLLILIFLVGIVPLLWLAKSGSQAAVAAPLAVAATCYW